MSSNSSFSRISRRVLLTTAATLPILSAPALSVLKGAQAQTNPLPSWNNGATKQAVTEFVARVNRQGGPDFVPPDERIATFDNDGTLWVEHPMYVQLAFALDRVKAMAPMHPEWKDTQPFKAVLEGDMKTLGAAGEHGMAELVMATHAGMTTEEFQKIVMDWLASARHPRFKRPYTELSYQPFRRRSANAAMDDDVGGRTPWPSCPSYRCKARICLRPEHILRPPRQGIGRRGAESLGRRRYEKRLEAHLRV